MELNTRGRYAVMALADIARHGGDGAVALPQIAGRQHISLAYLEQIFVDLKKAGIVKSSRGRSGGYRLARHAGETTVGEVMAAVGEPVEMTRCAVQDLLGCVGGERCLTHDLWRALSDRIAEFLASVTLADLAAGVPANELGRSSAPVDRLAAGRGSARRVAAAEGAE